MALSYPARRRGVALHQDRGRATLTHEVLEDLVGYVATELNANPRDLDLYARRGLLKGEQLHALARCVHYGRLGRLDQRDFERQTGAASCLLLILAAIIYT